MSKPKLISSWHKQLLGLILQNKYVVNNILMGDKLVGNIEINDDGSVRYYTKDRWFKWLCILFGDYKDLSFRELVLTLIDIISGPNNQMNSRTFDGMTKEFMENAVRSQKYDYIIDMIVSDDDMPCRLEQNLMFVKTLEMFGCPEEKRIYKLMEGFKHCKYDGREEFANMLCDYMTATN